MIAKSFSFDMNVTGATVYVLIKNIELNNFLGNGGSWQQGVLGVDYILEDILFTTTECPGGLGLYQLDIPGNMTDDIWQGTIQLKAFKQTGGSPVPANDMVGSVTITKTFNNDIDATLANYYTPIIQTIDNGYGGSVNQTFSFDFDKYKDEWFCHLAVKYTSQNFANSFSYTTINGTMPYDPFNRIDQALNCNSVYYSCLERLCVVEILNGRLIIKKTSDGSADWTSDTPLNLMIARFPITKGEQLKSLQSSSFKNIVEGINVSTPVFVLNNDLFYSSGTTLYKFNQITETFSSFLTLPYPITNCFYYTLDIPFMIFVHNNPDSDGNCYVSVFDGTTCTIKSKFYFASGKAIPDGYTLNYIAGANISSIFDFSFNINTPNNSIATISTLTDTSTGTEISYEYGTASYMLIHQNTSENIYQTFRYHNASDPSLYDEIMKKTLITTKASSNQLVCIGFGSDYAPTTKYFTSGTWPLNLIKMPEFSLAFAYGTMGYNLAKENIYSILFATQYPIERMNSANRAAKLIKNQRTLICNGWDVGLKAELCLFDYQDPLISSVSSTEKDIENSTFIKTILPTSLTFNEGKNVSGDVSSIKYLDGSSFSITTDENSTKGIDVLVQCNIPLDFYSGNASLNIIGTYNSNTDLNYHVDAKVYNWITGLYEYTNPELEIFENDRDKTFYTTQLSTSQISSDGRVLIKFLHDFDGASIGVNHVLSIEKIEIVVKKIDDTIQLSRNIDSISQVKCILPTSFEIIEGNSVDESGNQRTPFITDICYFNEPAMIISETASGLELNVDFDIPLDFYSTQAKLVSIASYDAAGEHYMKVQLYNNQTLQYEDSFNQIRIDSSDNRTSYTTKITDAQISDAGIIKVKYIHSNTTFNSGDKFKLQKCEVIIPKVQAQPEIRTEFWS